MGIKIIKPYMLGDGYMNIMMSSTFVCLKISITKRLKKTTFPPKYIIIQEA